MTDNNKMRVGSLLDEFLEDNGQLKEATTESMDRVAEFQDSIKINNEALALHGEVVILMAEIEAMKLENEENKKHMLMPNHDSFAFYNVADQVQRKVDRIRKLK